ncbi:probable 4-coumarate--CoA ligase 3 isoform X2 [Homarus americanus]|nr:probable 4-coumarate--CoA ligase 3 isoform X2 [Homarus americanus]XP_042211271.1 probable 4-coumarate--CoA ligase 3 isoform X2 [Homarus americanus]XP_042211272.1 probable 4-coumarate--CoA ligase 3 isoform X2 [Homarus americanus]XP_042211273.1 probable 4-coumarate--CoA ligase 3 isoform X2 [Homarus americanus]XP_042211274.1 probable 4-coumarate--CoA ligase 3 isoform X2 [Homarus americanus]
MRTLTSSLLSAARVHTMRLTSLKNHTFKFIQAQAPSHARAITTKSKTRSPSSALPASATTESSQNIVASQLPDVDLTYTPVTSSIFSNVSKWSHKTAIECGVTGRSYTYGQIVDAVMKFGGLLQKIAGDGTAPTTDNGKLMVAILSPNSPEYPIIFYGTTHVGATITTINPTYTPGEVATHLSDSGAGVLVVDAMMEPLADATLLHLQQDIHVLVNGTSKNGRANLREIISSDNIPFAHQVDVPGETVASLPYSSGTTGKPKGVCLSQIAISNIINMFHTPYTAVITNAEGDHQDVLIGLLPFFHIYGMMVTMSSGLKCGTKIITLPKFDPQSYVTLLKKHKVSSLHVVPSLLQFIAMSPAVSPADLASVKSIMCGSAPVLPNIATMLKEKASNPLFFQEVYGMTEISCSHMTICGEEKLGSCGKLLPNTRAKIVDLDTGATLPSGAKGELYVQTPARMTGYHNNPQATKEVMDMDGWVKTGDLATYDDEGNFTIIDRMKELIKVKGMQVSPSELEDVLLGHPGVAEVGIVGVDDERAGEVPQAFVVRRGQVTEDELQAFMQGRVAPHKQLAGGIKFVDQLPKNATGKLLKHELKKIAQQE